MTEENAMSQNLYTVILTTRHINKNPNNVVERLRVPGTYISLLAAKAAAHSCLYDAGYEREWFDIYETRRSAPETEAENGGFGSSLHQQGLMVYATGPDGTIFRVWLKTTPNDMGLASDLPDGRVSIPLYYVIQADVEYYSDGGASLREINIQGTFTLYEEARKAAGSVLLSSADGITKDSFARYSEAGPDETDCGYGENVVIHAVSDYGINHLVMVIKNQELEAVSTAEAAMKIL